MHPLADALGVVVGVVVVRRGGPGSSLRGLSEKSAFSYKCIQIEGRARTRTLLDVDWLEPIGPQGLRFIKNDAAAFQDLFLHGRHIHGAEFGLCIGCCFRGDSAGFA